MMWKLLCLAAVLSAALHSTHGSFSLERDSVLAIPYDYNSTGHAMYKYDEGAGEQMALDKSANLVYVVGESKYLHVVDVSDTSAMSILHKIKLAEPATDVALCGDFVAVGIEGGKKTDNGEVFMFKKYNVNASMPYRSYTTGPLPDMIIFTSDCMTLLTANEGEGKWYGGDDAFVNPEGSVSIFEWTSADLWATPTVTTPTFGALAGNPDSSDPLSDPLALGLLAQGVLWPARPNSPGMADLITPNHTDGYDVSDLTLTRNLEPEYIALSGDEQTAYVVLQESSAIAVLDLGTKTFTAIHALGFKAWKDLEMDASNKDDGINMREWDIMGVYQPDTILTFTEDGVDYIVTANEGDAVEYDADGPAEFTGDIRGADIVDDGLLDASLSAMEAQLSDKAQLGRLKFDKSCSVTSEGKVDKLCALSTRSVSIFRAADMELVYDSGDDIEQLHRTHLPAIFNSDGADPGDKQSDEMDSRSDDKGVEVETLAMATIDGHRLLFVGCERTSTLVVFEVKKPWKLEFRAIRQLGSSATIPEALGTDSPVPYPDVGAIDPESMYVDESRKKLFVAGSVSGTLVAYSVEPKPNVTMTESTAPFSPTPAPYTGPTLNDLLDSSCAQGSAVRSCVNSVIPGGDSFEERLDLISACGSAASARVYAGIADCFASAGDASCCGDWDAHTDLWESLIGDCTFGTCQEVGDDHSFYFVSTVEGTRRAFLHEQDAFIASVAAVAQILDKWVSVESVVEVSDIGRRRLLGTTVQVQTAIKTPSDAVKNQIASTMTVAALNAELASSGLTVSGVEEYTPSMSGASSLTLVPSALLALATLLTAYVTL